jgi:predicted Zn-dependent protease
MERQHIAILPIVIAALVFAFQYCSAPKFKNPETGKTVHVGLSEQQETALGLQSYEHVLATSNVLRDGPEHDLVVKVASRLTAIAGDSTRHFDWRVSVVRSPQVNAFCLPGGKIVVYTGLLPVAKTEEGLATVLGHEIAHATARHGAQRVFQNQLANTVLTGAQTSLALRDMDPQKRQAVLAAVGAGAQFGVLLPFSRDHESEADEIGLMYMARAGYNPREAIGFWERMSANGGSQPPEFASTHPSHGTRIERLKKLMPRAEQEFAKAKR